MNHLPEDMENVLTGSQTSHASLRSVHSINPTQLMARIESYEGREKKGISDVRRTFCLFVTFDLLFVTLLWIIELNQTKPDAQARNEDSSLIDLLICFVFFMSYIQSKRANENKKSQRTSTLLSHVMATAITDVCHELRRPEAFQDLRLWKVNGGIENTLEREVVQYDYYSSYFDIFLLAVFRFKVLILAYAVCRLRHWWAIALFSQGAFGYVLPIISFILAWIETWFLDFKVLPQEAEEENRLLIVQDASESAALLPSGLSDGQFYSPPESEAGSEEAEEKQDSEKPLLEL
ncbi:STARD3 N-terminal-like protein isoform X2 [Lemur catta]|uniref:STARD3 N-terminal-like protein isoform X2 n=1 Tax=Lemur catta TaxID=9447 RepID=UPI001E268143|nr:STARD3 N-terminal-like protein isoform X2 [Lemur catta]